MEGKEGGSEGGEEGEEGGDGGGGGEVIEEDGGLGDEDTRVYQQ